MKKNLIAAILMLAILPVLFSFEINSKGLPIGSEMPEGDTKMQDISGKEISLKSAKDKNGILVMFSCNTCPYVIRNQGRTKAICAYALQQKIG